MKTKLPLLIIPILALILSGCIFQTAYAPQASPTPSVQSSGDVDTDLQNIDKSLEQDTDTDAAGVSAQDLGL